MKRYWLSFLASKNRLITPFYSISNQSLKIISKPNKKIRNKQLTKNPLLNFTQLVLIVLIFGLLLSALKIEPAKALVSNNPIRVFGQNDNFNDTRANGVGVSGLGLNYPVQMDLDSTGGLYLVDQGHNRVLYYPSGSNVPSRVLGQQNRFYNSNQANPPAADSFYNPWGLAVDSSDGVYVADSGNSRVVYYPAGSTTATRVYGQPDFSSSISNNGGVSATSLNFPVAVAVNAAGVYIADTYNNRILFYAGTSTIATRVYGQSSSFTNNLANNGGVSATSLFNPYSIALAPSGDLYVADTVNNRALFYAGTSTTATRVYGQLSDFTTTNPAVTADGLNGVFGITVDASGVYIVDGFRVLFYSGTSTTASRVYGQPDFTSFIPNNGGVSANSLSFSFAAKAGGGGLYVTDNSNNRELFYSGTSTTASRVYGQGNSFTKTGIDNAITTASNLYYPVAVKPDGAGGAYIADTYNNRVLHYPNGTSTADRVYGQTGSFSTNLGANQVSISANSLYNPSGLAVDSTGGLYIADTNNNRVLYYPVGNTTPSRVYGQPDYVNNSGNTGGLSANSLFGPNGLALDSSGGLYVADNRNYRVLHYPPASTTADRVYGQLGSFTSNISNNGGISANSLSQVQDLAVDTNNDLYIDDTTNNRVLTYPGTSTTATTVFGQLGSFTTNFQNELAGPVGVAVSADGVYASNSYGGVAFYPNKDPNPANVKNLGSFINADGYYSNPSQLRQNVQSAKVATDASGNLFIADQGNNRVVVYHKANPASDFINNFYPIFDQVYGQGGSFTTRQAYYQPPTVSSLNAPEASIGDATGGTYISDSANNRVLHYPPASTTPDRVYGQTGSFTRGQSNFGGVSANSLSFPRGLVLDSSNGLYVADYGNNRVLYYPSNSTTATKVYGQSGSFTTNLDNNGGAVSATTLNRPAYVALDSTGALYVADGGNNRVLYYPSNSTTAIRVYGQNGSFTTPYAGSGPGNMDVPSGLAVDSSDNLYVADSGNNRVSYFTGNAIIPTKIYTSATVTETFMINTPTGVAVDNSGLYILDTGNSRILYYPNGSDYASIVYGQPDFNSNSINNDPNQTGDLNKPTNISLDIWATYMWLTP